MEQFCGGVFWNTTEIWYSTNPDFPKCFQKMVLGVGPDILLWILLPLDIILIKRSIIKNKNFHIPWTCLNVFKIILPAILFFVSCVYFVLNLFGLKNGKAFTVDVVYCAVESSTYFLVLILVVVHKKSCIHSSFILLVYWLLKSGGGIFMLRSAVLEALSENYADNIFPLMMRMLIDNLTFASMILNAIADTVASPKDILSSYPEKIASPLSIALYAYFDRLAWTGYKRKLQPDDLWALEESYQCYDVYSEFDVLSCKEKQRQCHKQKFCTNVFKIIWQMNKWQIILATVVKWVSDILGFVSPLMLKQLVIFVSSTSEPSWKGYIYVIAIYIAGSLFSLCQNYHLYLMQQVGIRTRAATISAIYRKAIKLSITAKKSSTVGEIVNLMSVDSQRLMDVWKDIGYATSLPLIVGLALYLLWDLLGPSALVGFGVIIVMTPINLFIAERTSKLQGQMMAHKDHRTKLMGEILSGVKILKFYAWEMPFIDLVNRIRNLELASLRSIWILNAITAFLFQVTQSLMSVAAFATFVFTNDKHILDPIIAFASLSLFEVIRIPLNFVPLVTSVIVQAFVSVKRINKFMAIDEIDSDSVTHEANKDEPIVIHDGLFSWDSDEEPILCDISLTVSRGALLAIVGAFGSGKSSLLSAMLGEMVKSSGTVNTKGSIAYVSQQAWIQNATMRDNILFGKTYNKKKYDKIIEACALAKDFDILPAGDETEIGEKGANLSGGQKQRVSLARAVYNDADIYLLDDPLSAVDAHVGKHIFESVIGPAGLLNKKTRVLVTHGIAYLPYVTSIAVLGNGTIVETGSYQALLSKGGGFSEFLTTYLNNEDDFDEVEMSELLDRQGEFLLGIEDEGIKRRMSERIIKIVSADKYKYSLTEEAKWKKRMSSRQASEDKLLEPFGKLTEEEEVESGNVSADVYIEYIKSIGLCIFIVSFIILGTSWAFSVVSNIWLDMWSDDKPNPDGTQIRSLRELRVGVYGALELGECVFGLVASLTLAYGSVYASKHLHNSMLMRVLRSPMTFFDTTPLGRIVNRFSRDIDVMDYRIPTYLRAVLDCFFQIISIIVVISLGNAFFLVVLVPLMIVYYLIQKVYLESSRHLRRLESASRSPIYSHFSETITGLTTIRAFGCEEVFLRKLEDKVDYNHVIYYPTIIAKCWLGVRLEAIGQLIILTAGIFAVIGRDTVDPGLVGLSVSYALTIAVMLTWTVRNWTDFETNIVSVERIKQYLELPNEASWTLSNVELSSKWPEKGAVDFKKYSTCYREGLDFVLKQITCNIRSGEKIGIVGRTGAGKSSLMLALFRLVEGTEGVISIDGIDIGQIGLHNLRSKLTIIPQDPVLFCGSLRLNLDPFNKYSDEDIWRALEHSYLKDLVISLPDGLNHEIAEGGENLSIGQRQLVCLARALLRKTKIFIMDEATAAIDLETDDLIQTTIRREFADCTVITIAHRLNTIMDNDRVMVLQNGSILEFDSPITLLQRHNSVFYSIAKDAGLV